MQQRLTAATDRLHVCIQEVADTRNSLVQQRARAASLNTPARGRTAVRRGERALTQAQARQFHALNHYKQAQADYDSTRDGLHWLRDELDNNPADRSTSARYAEAIDRYEKEASQREITFGPQLPLSRAKLGRTGATGKAVAAKKAHAWLKSAATLDPRTGIGEDKVNIVWADGDARRSVTIPLVTTHLRKRNQDGTLTPTEPTLEDVCDTLDATKTELTRTPEYRQWLATQEAPDSLPLRQRWRAARKAWLVANVLTNPQTA